MLDQVIEVEHVALALGLRKQKSQSRQIGGLGIAGLALPALAMAGPQRPQSLTQALPSANAQPMGRDQLGEQRIRRLFIQDGEVGAIAQLGDRQRAPQERAGHTVKGAGQPQRVARQYRYQDRDDALAKLIRRAVRKRQERDAVQRNAAAQVQIQQAMHKDGGLARATGARTSAAGSSAKTAANCPASEALQALMQARLLLRKGPREPRRARHRAPRRARVRTSRTMNTRDPP